MRALVACVVLVSAVTAFAFPEGNRILDGERTQVWQDGKIYDTNPDDPDDRGVCVGHYVDNGDGTWNVWMWDPDREEFIFGVMSYCPVWHWWFIDEYFENGEWYPYAVVE